MRRLVIFLLVAGGVALALLWRQGGVVPSTPIPRPKPTPREVAPPQEAPTRPTAEPVGAPPAAATLSSAPPRKGTRSLYGDLPEGVQDLSELPMANTPSPDWLPRLESRLRQTGGKELAKLELVPQESYIIVEGGEGRNVERVVVTVRRHDGRFTRFFAEVDSESGHVLKSWGATIHESGPGH